MPSTPVSQLKPSLGQGFGKKLVGRVDVNKTMSTEKLAAEKASVTKSPVEKCAATKADVLDNALELSKEAMDSLTMGKALMEYGVKPAAKGLATTAAAVAVSAGIGAGLRAVQNKLGEPKFEEAFEKALVLEPKLNSYPRETLREYAELVLQASPTVATNPLLLGNYLRYLVDHQGSVNFSGFRQLVDLEGQMLNNRDKASPLISSVQKTVADSTIKGFIESGIDRHNKMMIEKYKYTLNHPTP